MSGLTTHVLDTMHGLPAAGVAVRLMREGQILVSTVTNADGRTDAPLLQREAFTLGIYEIVFEVGAYFRAQGTTGLGFLDSVPVRFTLAEYGHYHVPLLVTPWSYATYRGS